MPRSLTPPPRPADWWRLAHDPAAIAKRAAVLARKHGLRRVRLGRAGDDPVDLYESRPREGKRPRVYLSAAIHGDEPAGAEGLLRWWEQAEAALFARFDFTIVPCLNPGGLRLNTRTDPQGRDLNRSLNRKGFPILAALKAKLNAGIPFALSVLHHEDYDGCGMYVYELAPRGEPKWGHGLLRAARPHCPFDPRKTIEGRRADRGVIAPAVDSKKFRAFFRKMGMAEAPWLFLTGRAARSYTVETPSEFDLSVRAEAHRAFLAAALKKLRPEPGVRGRSSRKG